ncbi:hypothetical protein KUV85_09015 [Nocardioides panacisoli]|uniref:hypothetical protein n=1 Tax=Nocardioides panacisoli TaxID=627624 RepID=UPI001C628D7A|nr:hypothetical protein [Nocardioides panacisoli]QYJ02480.1 hypothetical protein KUV85_09015 [Nocardioides panacisoli]
MTARRVHVHIGLPKTGTSYLQSILWPHRDRLRAQGLLLPGREKRDHLLASLIVREDPAVVRRGEGAELAWDAIREDLAAHDGDAVISHEFFCSASATQAQRLVSDLAPAEVHVVLTAREPLGLLTSSWQESLKNKSTTPLAEYGRGESEDPREVWDWRALDLGLVLERWGSAVPDRRVHVLAPTATDAPREDLWQRFAALVGIEADAIPHERAFANSSLGVVEAELLRRVNGELSGFGSARERARWIRTVLADRLLVTPDAERFLPDEDQVADARRRGERTAALLAERDFDVIGDPELLRVPDDLPARRHPEQVSDAEVLRASVRLNAQLLAEARRHAARAEERRPPARRGGRLAAVVRRLRG